MIEIPFAKEAIAYKAFTNSEWGEMPKDNFDKVIRAWCTKHNFLQYVEFGKAIAAKLPYKKTADGIECALDFLEMVERHKKVFIERYPKPVNLDW